MQCFHQDVTCDDARSTGKILSQQTNMAGQLKTNGASKKIVEETKRLYGPILAKPLDEKQLLRPSFKFIQDLVKSLMIETKLLRDVFNANHFTDKQPDKRARIEFIQKLIDFAAINRQAVATCLATKVVSGLEPNKTNELLQSLARIAQQRLDSSHDERRPRTFIRQTSGSGSRPSSSAARIINQNKTTGDQHHQHQHHAPQPQRMMVATKQKEIPPTMEPADHEVQSVATLGQHGSVGTPVDQARVSSQTQVAAEQQRKLTTESDITRGTQLVRNNLRSLKETFATICKVEDSLRASLMLATGVRDAAAVL